MSEQLHHCLLHMEISWSLEGSQLEPKIMKTLQKILISYATILDSILLKSSLHCCAVCFFLTSTPLC